MTDAFYEASGPRPARQRPPSLRRRLIPLAFAAMAACAGRVPPSQRPHLAIVTSIGFAKDSGVTGEIRECELAEELIEELEDEADRYFRIGLVSSHEGLRGRVLVMRFARVVGEGGGGISGAKSVTLLGRLLEDGEVIGSFTAQRSTGNAYLGGYYRSTCDLLEHVTEELAEDVTAWLRAPTLGALLGDL